MNSKSITLITSSTGEVLAGTFTEASWITRLKIGKNLIMKISNLRIQTI